MGFIHRQYSRRVSNSFGVSSTSRSATLALAHVNDHALAVDIGDLEVAHLGSAQTGCIEHHYHGPMHQVPC
jgi:hypothetical protein